MVEFAKKLEESVMEIIEAGVMTKDLFLVANPKPDKYVNTEEFIEDVKRRLEKKL